MPDKSSEMLKGILEGLVLEIINRQEVYGYEIVKILAAAGFEDIAEGTVYTILVRLEKNKLVSIVKQPSSLGPPRKFYSLNESGKKECSLFWQRWDFLKNKVQQLRQEETI